MSRPEGFFSSITPSGSPLRSGMMPGRRALRPSPTASWLPAGRGWSDSPRWKRRAPRTGPSPHATFAPVRRYLAECAAMGFQGRAFRRRGCAAGIIKCCRRQVWIEPACGARPSAPLHGAGRVQGRVGPASCLPTQLARPLNVQVLDFGLADAGHLLPPPACNGIRIFPDINFGSSAFRLSDSSLGSPSKVEG